MISPQRQLPLSFNSVFCFIKLPSDYLCTGICWSWCTGFFFLKTIPRFQLHSSGYFFPISSWGLFTTGWHDLSFKAHVRPAIKGSDLVPVLPGPWTRPCFCPSVCAVTPTSKLSPPLGRGIAFPCFCFNAFHSAFTPTCLGIYSSTEVWALHSEGPMHSWVPSLCYVLGVQRTSWNNEWTINTRCVVFDLVLNVPSFYCHHDNTVLVEIAWTRLSWVDHHYRHWMNMASGSNTSHNKFHFLFHLSSTFHCASWASLDAKRHY